MNFQCSTRNAMIYTIALIFATRRAETCSAGGGGGGGRACSEGGGGGVGKMGFRAGTLCYVVLAVLVQQRLSWAGMIPPPMVERIVGLFL